MGPKHVPDPEGVKGMDQINILLTLSSQCRWKNVAQMSVNRIQRKHALQHENMWVNWCGGSTGEGQYAGLGEAGKASWGQTLYLTHPKVWTVKNKFVEGWEWLIPKKDTEGSTTVPPRAHSVSSTLWERSGCPDAGDEVGQELPVTMKDLILVTRSIVRPSDHR